MVIVNGFKVNEELPLEFFIGVCEGNIDTASRLFDEQLCIDIVIQSTFYTEEQDNHNVELIEKNEYVTFDRKCNSTVVLEAVKLIKETLGWGLKKSKDFIDGTITFNRTEPEYNSIKTIEPMLELIGAKLIFYKKCN